MPIAFRRFLWPKSLAGKAGVVVIVACVILNAAFFWSLSAASRRLDDAWKLSEEFGLPNEVAPLLGEWVPDLENSAIPLDQAASVAREFILAERKRLKDPDDQVLLADPSYLASMDKLLKDTDYDRLLTDADKRRGYHSTVSFARPLVNTNIDHLQDRRWHARAEQTIGRRLASQGRRDEAVLRLVRMIRLTRRWQEREPLLIAALINISVRGTLIRELNSQLRSGPLPSFVHDAVEEELAKTEDILKSLPRIAQYEKIAAVEYREYFPFRGSKTLANIYADDDRAFMIRHIHEFARTYDRPFFQIWDELERSEQKWLEAVNDPVRKYILSGTRMLLPAMKMGRIAFDRLLVFSRCTRIINAMSRRNDFSAEFKSLGLPPDCIIDPFDGKPLRIKRTSKGPMLYSVAENQKDDGGTTVGNKDVVLEPAP